MGVALAIVGGVTAALMPEYMLALVAIAVVMAIALVRPGVGIAIWLVFTILTPSWTQIPAGGTVIGPAYIAIPIVIAVLLRRLHDRMGGAPPFTLTAVDGGITLGVVFVILYQSWYDQALFLATNVVISLYGGYVIGRLARVSMQKVFVVAMVIVALWGIAEFLFSWHLFVNWQTGNGGIGPALQERGGFTRSEASLGHAIAYGACLVAAIPFTREFRRPLLLQAILAAGILVSFSRGPILALLITIALMFYADHSTQRRVAAFGTLLVGMVGAYYIFDFLYTGSGQAEVASSSSQRDIQIERTIDRVNWFGPATGAQLNQEGRYVTNGVDIVDSVPLRFGLDFGWVVCALLLLPVAVAVWRVVARKAGPAGIAVAGQVPVLLVTSFITQWQVVFMSLCGMAWTEYASSRSKKDLAAVADVVTN